MKIADCINSWPKCLESLTVAESATGRNETNARKKQTREKKTGGMGSHNLQRDTPFLDRLGFGGGTGRRGSCAYVREP